MAKKITTLKPIEPYTHKDKDRVNNPQIGLVTSKTDPDKGVKKSYQYDPFLDPQLQWAGKAEHTSFEIPTVSLHVHERIDAKTIIDSVKKTTGIGGQTSLFDEPKPLREALAFYQHKENWSNRLIAGDSLLVMNSLLEKEGMAGKVKCVYFDPPYGIKYGSNFQPFVNKRDVKDGKDEDLCSEPEMIKAFRDTWELGIHSYLMYLRDRLLLARELLAEIGSIFVQISDENVHHVREIMDEVFGMGNFVVSITFQKKAYQDSNLLAPVNDYILWYVKEKSKIKKCNYLFLSKEFDGDVGKYNKILSPEGEVKSSKNIHYKEINELLKNGWRLFREDYPLVSQDPASEPQPFEFDGKIYHPTTNRHWSVKYPDGLKSLAKKGRIRATDSMLYGVMFWDDNPLIRLNNFWTNMKGAADMVYVVQTTELAIQRCMLMSTNPGDLVLDITCGSGTTATVAEQWGRRWITCDTSRVALALAKQRLMTAQFDYYKLSRSSEGVASGFIYKTVPYITLGSIANNEPPATETLYDQPLKETKLARVTGPFTVEAVPAPYAKSFDEIDGEEISADNSIARSGETHRQGEWRDELLRTGLRAKNGNIIRFSRVETLSGAKYVQAQAETQEDEPKKCW